jgi:hypothetical protein
MIETDSHLKLLLTSILDLYKVIEHIGMLSIGIWQQHQQLNSLTAIRVRAGTKNSRPVGFLL